jgi:rhodanese-related sulfurtransferase
MPTHKRASRARSGRRSRRGGLSLPWIALAIVLVVAAGIIVLVPRNALPAEVDVTRAHAMYTGGALLVDVRTQAEFDEVHIPGSQLVPLEQLPDRLAELPRDRDIVVVCRTGNRNKEGIAILQDAGFDRVTCMGGGLRAWAAAGYPTEP